MFGIKRDGKLQIDGAIEIFKNVESKLQEGIDTLDKETNRHVSLIAESTAIINQNNDHAIMAHKILAKVKSITEVGE